LEVDSDQKKSSGREKEKNKGHVTAVLVASLLSPQEKRKSALSSFCASHFFGAFHSYSSHLRAFFVLFY
jgi:hypothetical protein